MQDLKSDNLSLNEANDVGQNRPLWGLMSTIGTMFKPASAHCVRETVEVLRQATPDFISLDLWPPNSPDLNPFEYEIWAVMQRHVYHRKIHTIDELKQRLIEVWCGLEQSTVNMAIDQWRKRLRACVRAKGGHFEHSL